jgi:speckle-type POZ protein
MLSFAGVTVLAGGKRCSCSESTVADGDGAEGSGGYHLLVVQGYSATKKGICTGVSVCSRPFTVGGHQWRLQYYPNGENGTCSDFISLYVRRVGGADKPVEAQFDFSFVDQAEKQNPGYIRGTEPCTFDGKNPSWGRERFVEKDAFERSANLRGDCVTIRCDIFVCNDSAEAILPDIGQHFHSLLHSEVGADVRFEVRGEIFDAHRCVLAARSTVFMAELFGPMKEGTATTSSVIQIKDMEARVFGALLSFIYTDSLPKMETGDMEEEDEEGAGDEVWMQDLLVAADRYDLQRLKFLCEKQLCEQIGVSSVASTLALAERHHCRGLKEACFRFLQVQSPSCLKTVMSSSDWDHIVTTYPSVLNELIAKLVSSNQK